MFSYFDFLFAKNVNYYDLTIEKNRLNNEIKRRGIMRKSLVIAIISIICILFASCSKEESASTSQTATAEKEKIVILGPACTLAEEQAAWDQVIASFTAETGIEVEQQRQGTWDDTLQRLQTRRISGEQVDLIVVGMGTVSASLAPAGQVMDLTELMRPLYDRFPEGVLDSCTLGGHLWVIPYQDASGTSCFYNPDLFEQYGLSVPTTLAEWIDVAEVFSANGIIPFMIQGGDNWAWAMPFFDTYGQATGGESVERVEEWLSGERSFNDPEVYEAMNALKALFDNGILTSESFATDEDAMLANFVQGRTAMIFGGTWIYASLKSMNPGFEIRATEFPVLIEGAEPVHAFATGDGALAIPSWISDDNLENVMRFVEYILRPENAKAIICANAGGNPIFEVVNGAIGESDVVTEFLNEVSVPHSVTYLDWIWPTQINDAICSVMSQVVGGRMSAEDAASYVQDQLDTLVSQEDYVYAWWDSWSEEDWQEVTPATIPDVTAWEV